MIKNILETIRETNDKNLEDIQNRLDTLLHGNKEAEKKLTLDDLTWKKRVWNKEKDDLFLLANVGSITLDGGWKIEIGKTEKGYAYDVYPVDKEGNYDRSRNGIYLNDFPKFDYIDRSYMGDGTRCFLSPLVVSKHYSEEEINKILSLIQEEVNKREAEKEQTNEGNEAEKEPELPVGEEEKIFTAEDLQFSPALSREYDPQTGEPIDVVREQAVMQFDNGYGISVCKKENGGYFTMILDANGKRTPTTELSSSGMISLEDIEKLNDLMKDIQKLDQDGCVKGKEPTERGKELKLIGACERGETETVKNLINGGVNVNINVVNVQMGDVYFQDSLLDRANGNREILELLANGGLDMNRIEQRANNRKEENLGTSCEEGSKNRLQYLKKMRKIISNMIKVTQNVVKDVVKEVVKTAVDLTLEITNDLAQVSENSEVKNKIRGLRDKIKNNIVEDVEFEDITNAEHEKLPVKSTMLLPEYMTFKNGNEK